MTNNSIIIPVLGHLFTAVLLLFCWRQAVWQRIISSVSNAALAGFSVFMFSKTWNNGILTMQAGNWPAPFGISFVADVFSTLMVLLTSFSGLAVGLFSTVGISTARIKYGYFPIFHFLLMGLNGAFLAGDIFNLYVWFEIIIIASFVLMTLGGRKEQIGGAIKYVAMNLLASVIFLTAIAILYGLTGSLNLAHLSLKIAQVENRGLVNVTAMLFFVGFGIKSAVFPLYFWLPASYHSPPSAIAAIFSGLLTKVGVYALVRVFTLIFIPDQFVSAMILVVAFATLLTGAFGAIVKRDVRHIFSYLIVCHIGYMIAGLGLFTQVALTGAIFYLIHDVMVKTNLFLVSGLIYKIEGTVRLKEFGGLYAAYPKLSLLIALVFFSLVGIPPLSGFWPKIPLFQAAFDTDSYAIISAMIIASFLTLYIIAKIWAEGFWKDSPQTAYEQENNFGQLSFFKKAMLVGPVILLTIISLYIGFFAENIVQVSQHIAAQLIDTSPYVKAVLGSQISEP